MGAGTEAEGSPPPEQAVAVSTAPTAGQAPVISDAQLQQLLARVTAAASQAAEHTFQQLEAKMGQKVTDDCLQTSKPMLRPREAAVARAMVTRIYSSSEQARRGYR